MKLAVDPNAKSGTVCQIGDNWFYFGGATAAELGPEEYKKNVPVEDILNEIYEVLACFRVDECFCDEYDYYDAYLSEHLLCSRKHDKGNGAGERSVSTEPYEEKSEAFDIDERDKDRYNFRWRNAFVAWIAWEQRVICFYLGAECVCVSFADIQYDAMDHIQAAKMIVDRLVAIRYAFELETNGSASLECQKYVADILRNPYEWAPRLVASPGKAQ